jgi:zinc protease
LLAAAVFSVASSSARCARAETVTFAAPSAASHFRLKNGLEVVLERMPGHPLVAVVVAYKAGRAYDPPGHSGLAHLVEHLTFRGSRHLPDRGIFEHLEAAGTQRWNGTTSDDLATYHAVVPAQHFALPLWIESERMAFTLEAFNEKNLELEQLRVKKELLQGNRIAHFPQFLNDAIYPEGHPYHLGSDEIEDVLAAELSDASWFFQRHYRPDNAYLVLAGGFPERAASEVEKYFGPIVNPPGMAPRLSPLPRTFSKRETLIVAQPVYARDILTMVFPAPAPPGREHFAFALALELLRGGGPWSLEQALVRDAALAEWLELDVDQGALGSVLRVSVQLRHGVEMRVAERALEDHLRRLAKFDDQPALREIRVALALRAASHFADPLASALAHVDELRFARKPFDLAADLAQLRALSTGEIAQVTGKFLSPERRLTAHLIEGGYDCRDGCVSHEIDEP